MRYSPAWLDGLRRRNPLPELIGRRVKLVRRGREYVGLCPFHQERTPSFFVVPGKEFFHCFGCGAHGDAIGFVMRADNLDFEQAIEKLANETGLAEHNVTARPDGCTELRPRPAAVEDARPIWVPILPVPDDAPALLRPDGRTVELINPKHAGTRKERTRCRPALWWAYRDARGQLLGYVLRMNGKRGKWFAPVTFCAGVGGARQWCVVAFPEPRPLYGLAELAARPEAPVIVAVEGEKACEAGRRLLPGFVGVTWPGGSKSIAHVDWSPLGGRDVLLCLDNDAPARKAAGGWINSAGERLPGIAELLAPIAQRVRVVDPPADLEEGWDLANAEAEGWSPADARRWLLDHLRPAAVVPSSAPARAGAAPLDRRRLAGMVRKIASAGEAQLKGTLAWAAGVVAAAAVPDGEIEAEFGVAVLASAAQHAGLPVTEARRTIAVAFRRANL